MRPLLPGDDHNLLANRSKGDPHPQYSLRLQAGLPAGPLPVGTHAYQTLVWTGTEWVPDNLSSSGDPLLTIDYDNDGVVVGGYATPSEKIHLLGTVYLEGPLAFAPTNISTTPYNMAGTENGYITVDTSGAAITINLPSAAGTRRSYIFKDNAGNAFANNITIVPDGTDTIDGAASFLINDDWGAVWLIADQTSNWGVI